METTVEKLTREQIITALVARDGNACQLPGCTHPLDFSATEGPTEVTIDHWIPQHFGKAEGWAWEEIWDLDNLKLMHKKCNAKKGDRVPNEDGRPDLCLECDNGHNLLVGEICGSCGCDAQRFPRSAKVRYDECDHEILWCWVCSITPDMRPASYGIAMRQADSDELGEF